MRDVAEHQSGRPDVFEALRGALPGRVTVRSDRDWGVARRAWNLAVDQRPLAVIEAAGPEDVQAVVRVAAREGLRVAPQATGHGSEALGSLDGAVLLKTSRMRGVVIDPSAGVARVGAGALAAQVSEAAAAYRLAPVLGLAPSVGVAGFALGGGTGWLSRSYGLGASNIRALEVVTATGERRRADAQAEPELFWALRGGGGRFAIVTGLELEVHSVGEVSAGMVAWRAEHAGEVLEQFRSWTSEAPESLGAVFRYLALPDLETVPAPVRGRRIVAVIAAHLSTEADGRRLMRPLRASAGRLLDTFGPVGPADLVRVAGDREAPSPARGDGFMVDRLDPGLVDAIANLIAEDALAPLGVLELRLLGGALARASEGGGALAKLDGAFAIFAGGPAFDAGASAAIDERLDHLRARLAPWTTRQALLNSARSGTDPARAFGHQTWARLRHAQDTYDVDRLILSNHADPED